MIHLILLWSVLSADAGNRGDDTMNAFSNVRINAPFDRYLRANPLLMEMTGAKVINLPDGRKLLLSVASVAFEDGSAKDRLRVEKVARAKALAHIVEETQGVQIWHAEELQERTRIVLDHGKEKATSVTDYLEITRSKVEGIAPGLPTVGRWKSHDGEIFYLAIGGVFDRRGNLILQDDWKSK